MAFRENDTTYTTYNGAHIANFRIPLVFYHPHLPCIQLSVNASTLSILPTILDLLASRDSLSPSDTATTCQLLAGYEGQSLIRTYRARAGQHQQLWHTSIMSVCGSFLAVSSAAYPHRLEMPLCKAAVFQFTDPSLDETERIKVEDWSIGPLARCVEREFGGDAGRWVTEAEALGTWWYWEVQRLWGYTGGSNGYDPELLPEWLEISSSNPTHEAE